MKSKKKRTGRVAKNHWEVAGPQSRWRRAPDGSLTRPFRPARGSGRAATGGKVTGGKWFCVGTGAGTVYKTKYSRPGWPGRWGH